MKINFKNICAYSFVVTTIGSTSICASPNVTNNTNKEIKCWIEAFDGAEYKRCGGEKGMVSIAPKANHDFLTGGNTAFNLDKCAAAPKPAKVEGYAAWKLICSTATGDTKEVGLGTADHLMPGYLNVADPRKINMVEDKLEIQ